MIQPTIWFSKALQTLTFGKRREAKRQAHRRANYEFLKARIAERHFAGYGGLTVDFKGQTFDAIDLSCFKAPMYGVIKNQKDEWCIFWDRKKLTQEIGTGAPLKEGETITEAALQDVGRIYKQIDTDKIDDQKPLVQSGEGSPSELPQDTEITA